ncbi:MAG: hypothetical protein WCF44_01480 [Candidatus Methylophosphatis roskildensis]
MFMLDQVAIDGANHVFGQTAWACEKRTLHAGRVAVPSSPLAVLRLSVKPDGHFAEAAADSPADAAGKKRGEGRHFFAYSNQFRGRFHSFHCVPNAKGPLQIPWR